MLDFTKELCPDRPLTHPTSQTKNCRFGRYVEISDHCVLEETKAGDYTYCPGFNDIIYTALGKFNSIATSVRINSVQHPVKLRVTAYHLTYRCSHCGLGPDDMALIDWRRQNRWVVIGNGMRLGHNAVFMDGVTPGDGMAVGAEAMVTHDAAPHEVVGRVPARYIGWRYPPELITAMEYIRWWDWSHNMLRKHLRDFDDAAVSCRKFGPQ